MHKNEKYTYKVEFHAFKTQLEAEICKRIKLLRGDRKLAGACSWGFTNLAIIYKKFSPWIFDIPVEKICLDLIKWTTFRIPVFDNPNRPAGARLTISGEVTGKDGRRKQGEI